MYLKALRYAGGWLCHIFLKGISWFLSGGIRLDSHNFGVKRVIHITLIKLMLITIQYKEVGNVSQLLLKCINPSIKDLYSSSSDTELPKH